MVNMRDDAKIANHRWIGGTGLRGRQQSSFDGRDVLLQPRATRPILPGAGACRGSNWVRRGPTGKLLPLPGSPLAESTWKSVKDEFVANIKSQKKRNLTNEKARLRNKAVKSSLKTTTRKFREAADAGNTEEARELARKATRELDKAKSKGVIHANQAANRKSAIAKRAAQL
jgi:small subunit ribosomal protein S20